MNSKDRISYADLQARTKNEQETNGSSPKILLITEKDEGSFPPGLFENLGEVVLVKPADANIQYFVSKPYCVVIIDEYGPDIRRELFYLQEHIGKKP